MSLDKINLSQAKFFPLEKKENFFALPEGRLSAKSVTPDNSNPKTVKLQKACKDFEALFLQYLLKTMRSTIPKDEKEEFGLGQDIYQNIMDEEISKKIAQSRGVGISQMLFNRFSKEVAEKKSSSFPSQIPQIKRAEKSESILAPPVVQPDKTATFSSKYGNIVAEASEKYKVDPHLLHAVIKQESSFNPKAISPKGAKGLMQLLESTAKSLGVQNIFDPRENILAGAKYLRQLLNRFDGDIKLALAAYNAGAKAVEKYKGIPPFKETKNYVEKVWNFFRNLKGF
jgi:soluble lytic murein transglycosylase-like protein